MGITNRVLVAVFAVVFSSALCACSTQQTAKEEPAAMEETTDEPQQVEDTVTDQQAADDKTASVGDEIVIDSVYGEVKVTVDGFELSEGMRARYARGTNIRDSRTIGVLLLKIENVSYSNPYGDNYISLNGIMRLKDGDGITLTEMSSTYEYGEYKGAGGPHFDLPKGDTGKFAMFYIVSRDTDTVTLAIGDVTIPVPAVDGYDGL